MRAKAALTRASIRLQALRSSFERQKVALSSFWGNTNPRFAELSGSLSAFGTSDDFASLLQRAKKSPAIAIFASEARLKDAEVKLAQAQSRVDIGWQLGVRRFEEADDTALSRVFRFHYSVVNAIVPRLRRHWRSAMRWIISKPMPC